MMCLCLLVVAVMDSPRAAKKSEVAAPCASADMTITATFPNDVGFEGLWKYTISGPWEVGAMNALSHISFLFALDCPCACDIANLVVFPTPAGQATGEDEGSPCTADFTGLWNCDGDPTIGSNLPAIKFETAGACETQTTGTGTWCFYTGLSPLPDAAYPDAVVIKFGNDECTGTLTGALPDCDDCDTVPIEVKSWGKIKADFDEK